MDFGGDSLEETAEAAEAEKTEEDYREAEQAEEAENTINTDEYQLSFLPSSLIRLISCLYGRPIEDRNWLE